MSGIIELHTIEEWNNFKGNSTGEIIIFKYSPVCVISSSVEKDFDSWMTGKGVDGITCIKINVIESRPLSRHLADELGINHQSPQVIWLTKNHETKWHASHYDISSRNLSKKLNG